MNIDIVLYNSLTRKTEVFEPLQADNVRMYGCGPTVYDRAHIGNARAMIIYDLLFRILKTKYTHVTFVRNITDIDDKIINRAKESGVAISQLTSEMNQQFQSDMHTLYCIDPTHQPKATEHICDMLDMIQKLLDKDHAYKTKDGDVYFAVESYADYTQLSGRTLSELECGARIEVNEHKKSPHDFVLWKAANKSDIESSIYESPFGPGRPGWHIECSAMSHKYLGKNFDIHCGGVDLKFPHHTNEIAQSCCAIDDNFYAKYWVHNGFLTVNGQKMSKSLNNFITLQDVLCGANSGEVVRFCLLSIDYKKPLDWTADLLCRSEKILNKWYKALAPYTLECIDHSNILDIIPPQYRTYFAPIYNDLNISEYIANMHTLCHRLDTTQGGDVARALYAMGRVIGIFNHTPQAWAQNRYTQTDACVDDTIDKGYIEGLISQRARCKDVKDWAGADAIRAELKEIGVMIEDMPDGGVKYYGNNLPETYLLA